MERPPLKSFLACNSISQADFARGIERTTAFVTQLVSGDSGASQATIQRSLSFLSGRLGRRVTYEEVFGEPTVAPSPEAAA